MQSGGRGRTSPPLCNFFGSRQKADTPRPFRKNSKSMVRHCPPAGLCKAKGEAERAPSFICFSEPRRGVRSLRTGRACQSVMELADPFQESISQGAASWLNVALCQYRCSPLLLRPSPLRVLCVARRDVDASRLWRRIALSFRGDCDYKTASSAF